MSFQNAKLPSAVIIDMYRSTLVLDLPSSNRENKEVSSKITGIEFIGKNEKSIAILVACRQKMSETSPEIIFLLKILKACKLGIDDIALIDVSSMTMDLEEFVAKFQPSSVLVFATTFNGTQMPGYLEVAAVGEAKVVYAPDVQAMQADTHDAILLKKNLWTVLKKFFKV